MKKYRFLTLCLITCFLLSAVSTVNAVEKQTPTQHPPKEIKIDKIKEIIILSMIEQAFKDMPKEMYWGNTVELKLPKFKGLILFVANRHYLEIYHNEEKTKFIFKALKPGETSIKMLYMGKYCTVPTIKVHPITIHTIPPYTIPPSKQNHIPI